jgi:hypothetical protein
MASKRGAWLAAGATGLLIAAAATVGLASASSAVAAAPPVARPHWHFIFSAPKVKPITNQFTQQFSAVVATGKLTGWGFDGSGFNVTPTAWERTGSTWKKVAFPAQPNDLVVYAAASSPSNVWAFAIGTLSGEESRVLRWNGSKWSVVKTLLGDVWGATVLGPKDVWMYGQLGGFDAAAFGVLHYNGITWTQIGKNISGGTALNDHDVWGFTATTVQHWNGHKWTGTSVKSLLPAVQMPHGINDPMVEGVLALSDTNVYALGNGNQQDDGGPLVVLHFNGHKWSKLATEFSGYGPASQQLSSDGSGGLWIPMHGGSGAPWFLLHYAGGKLTKAVLPVGAAKINVISVSRIPGTTQQLAGGFTHAANNSGTNVVAVLLQYS